MLFHIPIRLGSILILVLVLFCAFTNAYKRIEKLIILFVSLIGFSFLFEVGIAKIDWGAAVVGWVKTSFPSGSMPVILSVLPMRRPPLPHSPTKATASFPQQSDHPPVFHFRSDKASLPPSGSSHC